jgi:hypothetical protein
MTEPPPLAVIVGGPNDGAEVPYVGPIYREPIPTSPPTYVCSDALPPMSSAYRVRIYRARRWHHGVIVGHEHLTSWRYVLDPSEP